MSSEEHTTPRSACDVIAPRGRTVLANFRPGPPLPSYVKAPTKVAPGIAKCLADEMLERAHPGRHCRERREKVVWTKGVWL